MDFSTIEITSKKVRGNNVDISTIEITSKQVRENNLYFLTIEITSKKYVESTWIFRPSKLHRKSTWNRRGNSSKFGLRRIDVISTSNPRRFDVVCPLGKYFTNPMTGRTYHVNSKVFFSVLLISSQQMKLILLMASSLDGLIKAVDVERIDKI